MHKILVALSLCFSINSYAVDVPNKKLTPGSVRVVTVAELCVPGYASSHRYVTAADNLVIYRKYGMPYSRTGYCSGRQGCEIDHLISLELGGNNDHTNLWPQPYDGAWNAHMKNKLEDKLHYLVCHNKISIADAQKAILDWKASYVKYIHK